MPSMFDAESLITLPRLDAASAIALGHELLLVAQSVKELPSLVERSRARLEVEHNALQETLQGRLGNATTYNSQHTRQADQAEDQAFAALYDFLSAFARLPESYSESSEAQHVRSIVFNDGLKFLTLAYRMEWAEAEMRIQRLRHEKLDRTIQKLGGEVLLKNLYAAHHAYGEALGITKMKLDDTAPPKTKNTVREGLQKFSNALRMYVLRIVAHQEESESDTASHPWIATLIQPLVDYNARVARTSSSKASPPNPELPEEPHVDS